MEISCDPLPTQGKLVFRVDPNDLCLMATRAMKLVAPSSVASWAFEPTWPAIDGGLGRSHECF